MWRFKFHWTNSFAKGDEHDRYIHEEKPVFPLLVSMALPMVVSMLVNSLYNIIDSFYVAKISEDAMTALSLVYPVQNFINAAAIGFGVGINALVSLYLGAGERKGRKRGRTGAVMLPGARRGAGSDFPLIYAAFFSHVYGR